MSCWYYWLYWIRREPSSETAVPNIIVVNENDAVDVGVVRCAPKVRADRPTEATPEQDDMGQKIMSNISDGEIAEVSRGLRNATREHEHKSKSVGANWKMTGLRYHYSLKQVETQPFRPTWTRPPFSVVREKKDFGYIHPNIPLGLGINVIW